MKCSVGCIDRVLRISVGLVLVVLAACSVIGEWGLIGTVPIASGVFKFCQLYTHWLLMLVAQVTAIMAFLSDYY